MQSDLFHKNVLVGYHDNASGRGTSVRIEPARILSVDREAWTVHAQPEGDDHIITDVPMLSMYEHVDGSGIYFLPRRGARGLLVYYDRGGPRFLCYRSEALGQETYKGKKYDLKEGDMILRSSYGSHVLLDDTGIVELHSNPVLRMALMPYTNTLFMRAERLDLSLLGGRWMWSHQRSPRPLQPPRVGELIESPGKVTLTEEYRELANEDYRLSIRKGWHDDRAIYSVDYHEADDKKVLYEIGKIDDPPIGRRLTESAGGDDRLLLDIDQGSYRQTIGERDDGTVVRTKVTGRASSERGWQRDLTVGKGEDNVVVHDRVVSGTAVVDLSIKADEDEADRIVLDVDDGSYRQTIGEQEDGTVVTTTVTGRADDNRDWRKETQVGQQEDETIVHDRVETGPVDAPTSSVDFTIKNDGQIDLDINDGNMTLKVETDGSITIHTEGITRLVCEDIRLGDAESTEQAILGNLFQTRFNELLSYLNTWLSTHKAIGNLGAPISPPLPTEIMDIVSNLSGTGTSSRHMPSSELSPRVKLSSMDPA